MPSAIAAHKFNTPFILESYKEIMGHAQSKMNILINVPYDGYLH